MPSIVKKITYVVDVADTRNHDARQSHVFMPLTVTHINGEPVEIKQPRKTHDFGKKSATVMLKEHAKLSPQMGQLANTVIEYLDEDTSAPVVQVFPQSMWIMLGYDPDTYMSHLNRASRADLKRQVERRTGKLQKIMEKQR